MSLYYYYSSINKGRRFVEFFGNHTESICALVMTLATGFIFSFLPYLIWWHSTGQFVYIADPDNEYYLQLASRLYFGNPFAMRDVVMPSQPVMYQSLQFFPAVLVALMFRLPVLDVGLIWHFWSAAAMAIVLYYVFLHWLRYPWAACACAIIILADAGTVTAGPLVFQVKNTLQAVTGHLPTLYGGQDLLGQWRFIDPAIGLPLLWLQVLAVSSAVEGSHSRRAVACAGIFTALLFYTWFFYWSAAVVALGLALILQRGARRAYAEILGIGGLGGLPAVGAALIDRGAFIPEALRRIGLFDNVPRFGVLLLPKVALLGLAATGLWIWRKPGHTGLYLWGLSLAALLLENNHIFTGMNLLPGHWSYVWGPSLGILVLLMAMQLLEGRCCLWPLRFASIVSLLVLLEFSTGIALRMIEVTRNIYGQIVLQNYEKFVEQYKASGLDWLPAGTVVAGDPAFCDLATIARGTIPFAGYPAFLSLSLSDREWELREALNAHLLGLDRSEFQREASADGRRYAWGQSGDPRNGQKVERDLMQAYSQLDATLDQMIYEFDISYIAIPVARLRPEYLRHGWRLVVPGPGWSVWIRQKQFTE